MAAGKKAMQLPCEDKLGKRVGDDVPGKIEKVGPIAMVVTGPKSVARRGTGWQSKGCIEAATMQNACRGSHR